MERIKAVNKLTSEFYYHSESLLLQFILYDFLHTSRDLNKLRQLVFQFSALARQKTDNEIQKKLLSELVEVSQHLAGSSYIYLRLFSWKHEGEILHKLNNYCALFSRISSVDAAESTRLYEQANQMWMASIRLHDLFFSMNDTPEEYWSGLFSQFQAQMAKLNNAIKRFLATLSHILLQYASDENIIFFILRHVKDFDLVYYQGFVKNLFIQISPHGLENLKNSIVERYKNRGFDNLVPIINTKFEQIQAQQ